jgi:hypothetical protein
VLEVNELAALETNLLHESIKELDLNKINLIFDSYYHKNMTSNIVKYFQMSERFYEVFETKRYLKNYGKARSS